MMVGFYLGTRQQKKYLRYKPVNQSNGVESAVASSKGISTRNCANIIVQLTIRSWKAGK